jgi:hypothetical protein
LRNSLQQLVFNGWMTYSASMRAGKAPVWQLMVLAVLCGSLALGEGVTVDEGRYQLILDRNPFSLKDPPPPPVAPPPSNPPPVEVNLKISGLSLTSQGKRAYFVVPPTPGKNTNTLYWTLAEGGQQGDVEVLSIDYEEGEVTVLNAGQQVVLSLENNAPEATGPANVPGRPGARRGVPRPPGARPAVPVPTRGARVSGAAVRSTPPRAGGSRAVVPRASSAGRVTPTTSRGSQTSVTTVPRSSSASSSRAVPTRPVRATPAQPVDPAMQWLLLKAQEEQARSQGINLPPTPPMPGVQQ